MKKFILTLGIFALTAVCANAQNKPLLSLNDMPHTAKGMRVELTKDGMMAVEARIMKNGQLMQTIRDEEGLCTDWYEQDAQDLVHFVDVNYDGQPDLFIGVGGSRTANSVLLWNPATNRFETMVDGPNWQNPIFSPKDKAVYTGGSNSAWEMFYAKSVWRGNKLVTIETLEYVTDLNDYNSNFPESRRRYAYILKNASGKVIKQTNSLKQLPSNWQKVVRAI